MRKALALLYGNPRSYRYILIVLTTVFATSAQAQQTFTLKGSVKSRGRVIPHARVQIMKDPNPWQVWRLGDDADEGGEFKIRYLDEGLYYVVAGEDLQYEPKKQKVTLSSDVSVRINLEEIQGSEKKNLTFSDPTFVYLKHVATGYELPVYRLEKDRTWKIDREVWNEYYVHCFEPDIQGGKPRSYRECMETLRERLRGQTAEQVVDQLQDEPGRNVAVGGGQRVYLYKDLKIMFVKDAKGVLRASEVTILEPKPCSSPLGCPIG